MGKLFSSIGLGAGIGLLNGILSIARGVIPLEDYFICLLCLFAPFQLLLFAVAGVAAVRSAVSEVRNITSAAANGAVAGLTAGVLWAVLNIAVSIAFDYAKIPFTAVFAFGGTDVASIAVRAVLTLSCGIIGGTILGSIGGILYASFKLRL
ncbi:hypothetical protein HY992_05360 [Candidatus Micrarchaeota archaeon]|nr:hypothetical protein [Candidatus Micrarchaeota archaeon]